MRGCVLGPVALAAALCGQASADEVVAPKLLKRPSNEELLRVLPARAVKEGKEGSATLECQTTTAGTLRNCKVLSEDPEGYGFGPAGVLLAPSFRVSPRTVDGQSTEGTYTLKINWDVDRDFVDTDSARVVPDPVWLEAPTRADVAVVAPPGRKGVGLMSCEIRGKDGRLVDCVPVDGADQTLGRAAVKLGPKFRTGVFDRKALPKGVGSLHVNLAVLFDPGAPAASIKSTKVRPSEDAPEPQDRFPTAARAAGVTRGKAVMTCDVVTNGALSGCLVKSETPPSLGFGEAALQTSQGLALSAWTTDGLPVDGMRIDLPLSFVDEKTEDPPTIVSPKWLRRPSADDLAKALPPRAVADGVDGRVRMRCVVGADGVFSGCVVREETPGGYGYGAATVGLAPKFKIAPSDQNGKPVAGGTFDITIRWVVPR